MANGWASVKIVAFCVFPFPCVSILSNGELIHNRRNSVEEFVGEVDLPQLLEKAVLDCGYAFSDIDLWATFSGPGPFTALRISMAMLHGLKLGTGARTVSPSFFDVIGHESGIPYVVIVRISANLLELRVFDGIKVMPAQRISEDAALHYPGHGIYRIESGVFPGKISPSELLAQFANRMELRPQ